MRPSGGLRRRPWWNHSDGRTLAGTPLRSQRCLEPWASNRVLAPVHTGPLALDASRPMSGTTSLPSFVRRCPTSFGTPGPPRRTSASIPKWGRLTLTVTDNGEGISGESARSGLANMRERATRHGGTLDVGPGALRGRLSSGACLCDRRQCRSPSNFVASTAACVLRSNPSLASRLDT